MDGWCLSFDCRQEDYDFDFDRSISFPTDEPQNVVVPHTPQSATSTIPRTPYHYELESLSQEQPAQSSFQPNSRTVDWQSSLYQQQYQPWRMQPAPSVGHIPKSDSKSLPRHDESFSLAIETPPFAPQTYRSQASDSCLSSDILLFPAPNALYPSGRGRHSAMFNSIASRSASPSPNDSEMSKWGIKNDHNTWRCAYPGCSSRSVFTRGCDLRKHFKRHTKVLFCRYESCAQAAEGGFSSKKDRTRHEAKHNPTVLCEWKDCPRLFSRVDNMKDHVRRVHRRKSSQ